MMFLIRDYARLFGVILCILGQITAKDEVNMSDVFSGPLQLTSDFMRRVLNQLFQETVIRLENEKRIRHLERDFELFTNKLDLTQNVNRQAKQQNDAGTGQWIALSLYWLS
jgi:hypothetical protein